MAFDPTLTTALLTALTPTVAVFIGILLQRQDSRDLRTEMDRLRDGLRAEMDTFRDGLRAEMDTLRDGLRADMVNLRNQVHADLLMIHERVAKVEARQGQ